MDFTQNGRFLAFSSPLGENKMQLTKIVAKEVLGRPYRVQLDLVSQYLGIEDSAMLGQPAKAIIYSEIPRIFQGVITKFQQGRVDVNGRQHYHAELMPKLIHLDTEKHNKYYYDLTVPDIARMLALQLTQIELNTKQLRNQYSAKPSIAQYQESDLDFIHRILAEEKLYYLFQQNDNGEQPFLRDAPIIANNTPYKMTNNHQGKPHIYDWDAQTALTPKQIIINRYQFTHPTIPAKATTNINAQQNHLAQSVWFIYDEDVTTDEQALGQARHASEQWQAATRTINIKSNIAVLTPGYSYTIENEQYVALEVIHTAYDHSYYKDAVDKKHYSNQAIIQPASVAITPKRIPIKKISSTQSATVITPTGQNIYTNEYAAVKTKLPWQHDDNIDIQRLPWARVSQWQSGMRWGSQFIPRINDEVLVDFFQGHPDRPVVVGSVYNASNKPAYDAETYNGLTSLNTQVNHSQSGHQLNLNDKPNEESLRLLVQGKYNETINNDATLQINGKENLAVSGQYKTQIGTGKSNLRANKAILQVGSNQIIIDASGIQLNGNKVTLKASGVGGTYPVARLGDNHSCNAVTGVIPHQGGAIKTGSSLLLVNNLLAARLNDTATCLPEDDTINEGINNIQVKGIPLARVAHETKHGGKITTGSSNVYVDDASFATNVVSDNIDANTGTMNIGQHWVQGHYPEQAGMSWRIEHQNGLAYQGVLDGDGKTDKINDLPNGTVDIHFGDKEQLEEKLAQAREDLQTQLNTILAAAKAENQKPTKFMQSWDDLNHANSPVQYINNFLKFQSQAIMTVMKGVTKAAVASGEMVVHLFMENAQWQIIQDQALESDFSKNPEQYQATLKQASDLSAAEMQSIEQSYQLLKLIMEDAETRKILTEFAEDYYNQTPGIVIAQSALEAVGGIYFAMMTAAVGGETSLLSEATEASATSALVATHNDAETIAETLEALKKVKTINGAEVDRVHRVETPEYQAASEKLNAYQTPYDFNDAENRLDASRRNIITNGCQENLKYTDAELVALAAKEVAPTDGYLVRLVKAAPEDVDLERTLVRESKTTWVTTFEQIESADTDPRLISAKLGLPYDPNAKYSLMLIKDLTATTTDANIPTKVITPTFANLTNIAKGDVKFTNFLSDNDVAIDTLDEVMNSEYSDVFMDVMKQLNTELAGQYVDASFVAKYLKMTNNNYEQSMARYGMNYYYGANEYYVGDGTTQYSGEGTSRGALEYMIYDDTGITLGSLKDQGKLSILPCNPIVSCPTIGVK